MILLLLYACLFAAAFVVVQFLRGKTQKKGLSRLKTVTFGDASAVEADRAASVISVLVVFLVWGAFTGSAWVPLGVREAIHALAVAQGHQSCRLRTRCLLLLGSCISANRNSQPRWRFDFQERHRTNLQSAMS